MAAVGAGIPRRRFRAGAVGGAVLRGCRCLRLLDGRVILRLPVGIGDVIRGHGRLRGLLLRGLLPGGAVGEARGGACPVLGDHCLGIVGGCALLPGASRGCGGECGGLHARVLLPSVGLVCLLRGGGGEIPFRLPRQEPGACERCDAESGQAADGQGSFCVGRFIVLFHKIGLLSSRFYSIRTGGRKDNSVPLSISCYGSPSA